jgi:hypothetical protein
MVEEDNEVEPVKKNLYETIATEKNSAVLPHL